MVGKTKLNIFEIVKNVVFVLLIVFFGWTQYNNYQQPTILHSTEAHQIAAGVAQGKTNVVSAIDTEKLSKAISSAIAGQIIKAKADILSEVEGKWSSRDNEHSANVDKYKIKKKQLYWKNDETGQVMPIGVALYSPKKDASNKDPWIAKAYNINFRTQVVRSIDRDGGVHNTIELTASPQNIKGYSDVDFPLNINLENTSFVEIQEKKYEWSLWNPTLSLGLGIKTDTNNRYGFIGKFNFINYGYKSQIPVWQFVSPVVLMTGQETKLGLEFTSYNIGELLPIIKDLHVGVGMTGQNSGFVSITSVF